MVSIQASSITRQLDLKIRNYNNLTSYYENLLIKNFPSHIRQFNLEQFIKFNLNVFLADYTVIICSKNGKQFSLKNETLLNSKTLPLVQILLFVPHGKR